MHEHHRNRPRNTPRPALRACVYRRCHSAKSARNQIFPLQTEEDIYICTLNPHMAGVYVYSADYDTAQCGYSYKRPERRESPDVYRQSLEMQFANCEQEEEAHPKPKVQDFISPAKRMSGKISDRAKRKIRTRVKNWAETLFKFKYNHFQLLSTDSITADPIRTTTQRRETKTAPDELQELLRDPKRRAFIRRRPVFLTLTLSSEQIHEDKEIRRRCLTPFVADLQRLHGVVNYVHVSEKQENGNIHFHLIIDNFIWKDDVRKLWNKHQDALGYVTRFAQKHGHRMPPSTEIEAVKGTKGATHYITKYITKAEGAPQSGRVWGMSDSLREYDRVKIS